MNTYTNIIVKGQKHEAIVAQLSSHQHDAFVSPTINGFTFVYTPFDAWAAIAEDLSRTLHFPVLFSYGYDGDVFGYTLYEDGQVRDEYESAPDYDATGSGPAAQSGPRGGQADLLCAFCGQDQAVAQVAALLHPEVDGTLLEAGINAYDQHWALAEALGLPPTACVTSYESLLACDYASSDAFDGALLRETP